MMTQPTIRSILRWSGALLGTLVLVAFVVSGRDDALGVLVSGLVMLTSFMVGVRLTNRLGNAISAGASVRASALVMIKLPVLCVLIWALLTYFPPLSVVIGGSTVILAVLVQAGADMTRARVPRAEA